MSELFAEHSRLWRQNRFVYPVVSRRSGGISIGINLNPDQFCNFDCLYCSVDRGQTPRDREVDLEVARNELDGMLDYALSGRIFELPPFDQTPATLRRVNDIAFSGDGEPTAYGRFGDACRLVVDLLAKRRSPDVKIIVITNATLLHRPNVRDALELLDRHNGEVWAKLDAGTEEYYRTVERTSVSFARVLENIRDAGRIRPIVIQSLFMHLHDEPPSAAEVSSYLQRLRELRDAGCRIKLVQVYTTARKTAEDYVTPLRAEQIDSIVSKVRDLGLRAEGFYGPA